MTEIAPRIETLTIFRCNYVQPSLVNDCEEEAGTLSVNAANIGPKAITYNF